MAICVDGDADVQRFAVPKKHRPPSKEDSKMKITSILSVLCAVGLASFAPAAWATNNGASYSMAPGPFSGTGSGGSCSLYQFTNHLPFQDAWPNVVVPIFWGSYWSTTAGAAERTYYDTAWNAIINRPSSKFFSRSFEYQVSYPYGTSHTYGIYTGSTVQNTGLASNSQISEATIQSELTSEYTSGAVRRPQTQSDYDCDNYNIYVIFLPPNVYSETDVNNSFAGHHGSFYDATFDDGTGLCTGDQIYYAVIEYSSDHDYVNPVVSHEIVETITDPINGWWEPGGNEVGDVCRGQYYTDEAGYVIEKFWSQVACACIGDN
jgi:hypothetical protein